MIASIAAGATCIATSANDSPTELRVYVSSATTPVYWGPSLSDATSAQGLPIPSGGSLTVKFGKGDGVFVGAADPFQVRLAKYILPNGA